MVVNDAPPRHRKNKYIYGGILDHMKTVLITGASDGIGRSIALKLSRPETQLVLFGRDERKLQAVADACRSKGATVVLQAFDLTDDTSRRHIVDTLIADHPVDVLINNAGIWHKVGDLTTIGEEVIRQLIDINLTAHILLTRQLLSHMRDRTGAAIVNIVSKSGLVPQAGQSVYTASKYGMRGFTDVLREDTKQDPIRIGAVYQSGTATQMFSKAGDDFPVDKFTDPDDLAEVIEFMLSRPAKLWLNEVHVVY